VDLLIDTKGAALRKRRDRLVVAVEGRRDEYAISDVDQVVLGPGVSVTSDALLLAAEHGTDVVVTDWREDPRGRLVTGALMGAALTKRHQLAALHDPRGVRIAWELAKAKCRNQANLLSRVDRDRPDPRVQEAVRRIRATVTAFDPSGASSVAEVRPGIFAAEGGAGRLYMEALGLVLPAELGFHGRNRRPPRDVVNAALSYGYGILHSQVQRALFLVGLEPSMGFLHVDRWGRSSLTLDAMEIFRQPLIDRAVLTLARRGQLRPDEHTEPHGPGLYLSADGRRLVAGQVFERLAATFTYRAQTVTWKQAIVLEARAIASYLLGHRSLYRAYIHRWA